jgi:hypothetical protein
MCNLNQITIEEVKLNAKTPLKIGHGEILTK